MRRQFPKANGAFYRLDQAVRAEGQPTGTDLWVYDVIGDDWAEPSLAAKDLCQAIAKITTDEIVLHIASPGGSCSDGIAIYNALTSHPATVVSLIEGWTASMATILALAANPGRISMFDNCMFMVHEPQGIALGDAAAMRDYAEFLDSVNALMVGVYMQRCTKPEEELRAALTAETYLSATDAAEWGFVDEVVTGAAQAAAVGAASFAIMGYKPAEPTGEDIRQAFVDGVITPTLAHIDPPATDAGDEPKTMVTMDMASILTASRRH